MNHRPLDGLYLVTDPGLCRNRGLLESVEAALDGGLRMVQYRDKSDDDHRRREEAAGLRAVCNRYDALLLVNDDIDLAIDCAADGVHLGRDDADIATARARLGPERIIGASCYNQFSRAERAAAAGADYVAFGSVFLSRVKPDAPRVPLELFEQARAQLDLPVCAIGGINHDNILEVAASGAHMFAVITALLAADDITVATRKMREQVARARG